MISLNTLKDVSYSVQSINKEEVNYQEKEISIKFNNIEEWKDNLYVIKTRKDFDFSENIFQLTIDGFILSKVNVNLRPRVTMAHGLETQKAQTISDESRSILEFMNYIDWNRIFLQIMDYKISKRYYNMLIDKTTIKDIIKNEKYKIYATNEQLSVEEFSDIDFIEKLILIILKNYIDKFYKNEEKKKTMENLDVDKIDEDNDNFNFKNIIVKIPLELVKDFEDVFGKMSDFYNDDVKEIPTIHFDKHLYSPLIVYQKGKERIKSSPIKLNHGETKLVLDLRKFIENNSDTFEDKKVFLLRNLSKKGIGFFQKTGGFYPDFILWIKEKDLQKMIFIDPKGIRNLGNFNDEKIQFCTNYIEDVEKEIKKRIDEKGYQDKIELRSFIISVTDYDSIKSTFEDGSKTREDFEEHNIIFQEGDYIQKFLIK